MTKLHRLFYWVWKVYMHIIGVKVGKNVFTYSDELGKFKFIKGKIVSLNGESVDAYKLGLSIDIRWDEPLQGDDLKCYVFGSYDYASFKKKIRFNPKFKNKENVLARRGSDNEPQWRELKLRKDYIKLANENQDDYIPVFNNSRYDRLLVRS